MELETVGKALGRMVSVFERRPSSAIHADSSATVSWNGGLRTSVAHPNGAVFVTDMPIEFGGGGGHVTPGWFMRAGAASCTATCIVMAAARREIRLTNLQVTVTSCSDARGNLGMCDEQGRLVDAVPSAMEMRVRICADGTSSQNLRDLVEAGMRFSSVARALEEQIPITLHVDCIH
jgi:uncharacterized OsmC-like protein